ncbi:hypothetical protein UPYG_G00246630 [Umbra pygmaea]|uniref:Ig-like domain-containing protein n=1 Tax=Umbra pygmaea TaxID=75934 RepID=A0ABD0WI07_UMBPY
MAYYWIRPVVRVVLSELVFCMLMALLNPADTVQVVGQADPVIALVGDDVILPCSLSPMTSAKDQSVNWLRPEIILKEVHFYSDGRDSNADQNLAYRGRTSLFKEELKNGNISLKMSNVKISDAGNYSCYVPTLDKEQKATIELTVGAVSQPVISIMGPKDDGVVLKCESGGWYPEPKMTWLNNNGSILPSDGPTETQTDSAGRYSVRGEVTIQKTDSNKVTCRVNQQQINKIKETEINVPDEAFAKSHGGLIAGVIIAVLVAVVAGGIGVFMWRKKKLTKKQLEEKEITVLKLVKDKEELVEVCINKEEEKKLTKKQLEEKEITVVELVKEKEELEVVCIKNEEEKKKLENKLKEQILKTEQEKKVKQQLEDQEMQLKQQLVEKGKWAVVV